MSEARREVRLARDGSPYNQEQFVEWYGSDWNSYWNEATWPHGRNSASTPVIQSTGEVEAGATEQGANLAGSTVGTAEHGRNPGSEPVTTIVSLQDLRALATDRTIAKTALAAT